MFLLCSMWLLLFQTGKIFGGGQPLARPAAITRRGRPHQPRVERGQYAAEKPETAKERMAIYSFSSFSTESCGHYVNGVFRRNANPH